MKTEYGIRTPEWRSAVRIKTLPPRPIEQRVASAVKRAVIEYVPLYLCFVAVGFYLAWVFG